MHQLFEGLVRSAEKAIRQDIRMLTGGVVEVEVEIENYSRIVGNSVVLRCVHVSSNVG